MRYAVVVRGVLDSVHESFDEAFRRVCEVGGEIRLFEQLALF